MPKPSPHTPDPAKPDPAKPNPAAPAPPGPVPPGPTPSNVPRSIGGYEVQRVLGEGGMATVYAALQKQPRRTVAIKVMRGATNAQNALRRFRREIEFLGRLRHPYIAQVYDAGVQDDGAGPVPYFVMEYVPGAKTVIEFVEARELSLRDRLKLYVKICAAVEHGHQNKIIHRDLKPGNILIDETGNPKIIDFGVARAVELDMTSHTATAEGSFVGTLQFMSPEQLDTTQQDLDARCDVYALGVLLYKLLTGLPPYDLVGLPVFTAAQIIRVDPPPRPGSIRPELKGDLETIILKSLAKERAQRYRTAGSLGRDLVRFLADKPIKAREAGALYRLRLFARRHRGQLKAGAVVGAVIVLAAAGLVYQRIQLSRAGDETAPPAGERAPSEAAPRGSTPERAAAAAARNGSTAHAAGGSQLPEMFVLQGRDAPVTGLVFDPTGGYLAASDDRDLTVWSVSNRDVAFASADHDAPVKHVAFSADGSHLATAADDGTVVIVSCPEGKIRGVVRHPCPVVHSMALSPSGDAVAIGCDDLTLRLIGANGAALQTIRATRGAFRAVSFSRDGDRLGGGAERGDVYVWRSADGELERRFTDLDAQIAAIAFAPEGDRLLAVTTSGEGRVWRLDDETGAGRPIQLGEIDPVSIGIDGTGRWIAGASSEGVVIVDTSGSAAAGQESRQVIGTVVGPVVGPVAVSPDGKWFATADEHGAIRVAPIPGAW